jgi:hypothetical protein
MREKDLIKQFKALKNIQPNKDWAASLRADLIRTISEDTKLSTLSLSKSFFRNWKFSAGIASFALMVFTALAFWPSNTMTVQNDLNVRILEAKQMASVKLSPSDALLVAQKLEEMEKEVANKIAQPKEQNYERYTAPTASDVEALTNILIVSDNPADDLRSSVQERLVRCEDEKLFAKVSDLLKENELPALIEAHFVVSACLSE